MLMAKKIGNLIGHVLAAFTYALCVIVVFPVVMVKCAAASYKKQFGKYCNRKGAM